MQDEREQRAGRSNCMHAYLLEKEEARRAAGGAMKQSEGASPATRMKSEAIFIADVVAEMGNGSREIATFSHALPLARSLL